MFVTFLRFAFCAELLSDIPSESVSIAERCVRKITQNFNNFGSISDIRTSIISISHITFMAQYKLLRCLLHFKLKTYTQNTHTGPSPRSLPRPLEHNSTINWKYQIYAKCKFETWERPLKKYIFFLSFDVVCRFVFSFFSQFFFSSYFLLSFFRFDKNDCMEKYFNFIGFHLVFISFIGFVPISPSLYSFSHDSISVFDLQKKKQ